METGQLEVTTRHSPFAFIYGLFKTTIEIDAHVERRPWGTHTFDVPAGEHTVAVSYPWLFTSRAGRNSVTVTVRAGETTRVAYAAGPVRYLPGKITVDDPIPVARVVKP
jgi:hypothetical protein